MAYRDYVERPTVGHGGGSTVYAPPAYPKSEPTTGPCPPAAPEPPTCCDLVCFDRPRYFCGHLLTDADLSLEQRYVIEKHKLYHRSLHGHGVVCGLRLTCDPVCRGGILVGEGFAIDDCGNDLVVCQPMPFDVLGRLREKKYLPPAQKRDECAPVQTEPDCKIRQCFYVTICYREEPHEFTTPLMPGCGPSPKDCEPTRTRETVWFDVLAELPRTTSPLEDLEARIEKCFGLFIEGPFAAALKSDAVVQALKGGAAGNPQKLWEECCKLRGLLLRYIDAHPDHYNCAIRDDIEAVKCPKPGEGDATKYGETVGAALCRIIELAYQHVMSCVFGELAFPCAEPPHASCIVLGTVEVEDDRVVRVCNCPRSYVWSFASFFQTLIATLLGPLACEVVDQTGHAGPKDQARNKDYGGGLGMTHDPATCCREFKLGDCASFVDAVGWNRQAASDVATAPLGMIKTLRRVLQSVFDPTLIDFTSARSFLGRTKDELAGQDNLTIKNIEEAPAIPDLLLALGGISARTPEDKFVLYERSNVIVDAVPQPEIYARVDALERELAQLRTQISGQSGGGGDQPRRRRPGGGGDAPTGTRRGGSS